MCGAMSSAWPSYIHDDIEWVIYAPRTLFGFTGPRQGKKRCSKRSALSRKAYAIESYVPKISLADGDRAAVVSDVAFTQRTSGRVLNFRIADVMRLRAGQIVEFEEFIDSVDRCGTGAGTAYRSALTVLQRENIVAGLAAARHKDAE